MRKTLLTCLLFAGTLCYGQSIVPYHATDATSATPPNVVIIQGAPYPLDKYIRITSGTPFFTETWMNGKVLLQNGSISRNLPLRLNLLDNKVHYLDPGGQEMVITEPMRYLMMQDSAGMVYSFLHGDQLTDDAALQQTWFQVLVDSRVSLCRQVKKAVRESKGYGSASAEQSIQTSDAYYIKSKGAFIHIKNWDHLLTLLEDKKELVRQYSKAHRLNGKSQGDYVQMLTYYNNSL